MEMKSMEMTKEGTDKMAIPSEVDSGNMMKYPYGLEIRLDDESIKKLDMKELPESGSSLMLRAKVEVVENSSRDTKGNGKKKSLVLQITHMALEKGEKMSNEKMAGAMYGKE